MCNQESMDTDAIGGLGCALEAFTDVGYVKETLQRIATDSIEMDGTTFTNILADFKKTVDLYQEQPHLMDKEMKNIVIICVDIMGSCDPRSDRFHECCKLLYILVKTRGFKYVRQHFPHEVPDLHKVFAYIKVQDENDSRTWETQYILLLWLTILATVPFELKRFDGAVSSTEGTAAEEPASVQSGAADNLLHICETYVRSSLRCSEVAAYMTACFLCRPDIYTKYLNNYLLWVKEQLATCNDSLQEFVRASLLRSVCNIFKMGSRPVLKEHSQTVVAMAFASSKSSLEFERKLALKLMQRVALCRLSSSLASWRYMKTKRVLLGQKPQTTNGGAGDGSCDEELKTDLDVEIPEILEEVIDALLHGLGDVSLNVRWSASKGLARITSRLSQDFAFEVVNTIFQVFEEIDRENLWHGGCMALAEMGRRGVLLPQLLDQVLDVLLQALVYDELRGSCSVGSIVRDAACYVAWTLGRSYDPQVVLPFVNQLSAQLVCLACFDREVNVRRAASAAFQECVGRLGNFPNGIALVTIADYFSIGIRKRSFLDVGVKVASFPEYTRPIIDHLLYKKVTHWDAAVRELSAHALRKIVHLDTQYFIDHVYKHLFDYSVCIDYNMRHGAIVTLGQITLALKKTEPPCVLPDDIVDTLCGLSKKYREKRYFELSMHLETLATFSELIACLAEAKLCEPDTELLNDWLAICNKCLEMCDETMRRRGVSGFSAILEHFIKDQGEVANVLSKSYQSLSGENVDIRCGHATLLGNLSLSVTLDFAPVIFSNLHRATQGEGYKFLQVRRHALISLASVCARLAEKGTVSKGTLIMVFQSIDNALEDYSINDSFFDVGLFARRTAIEVFVDFVTKLHRIKEKNEHNSVTTAISEVCREPSFQEIVSKIFGIIVDSHLKLSSVALQGVKTILATDASLIEEADVVQAALIEEDLIDAWSTLLKTSYRRHILLHLIVSMGAKTEKESTKAQLAVLKYLQNIQDQPEDMQDFCKNIDDIIRDPLFAKKSFMFNGLMRGFGRLLNSGMLANANVEIMSALQTYIWNLVRKTRDISKILPTIDVLAEMLQFEEVRLASLKRLSILIAHRHFPQVRVQTATKLYECVLMYSAIVPEENFDLILAVLSDTEWSAVEETKFETVRLARNTLCELLQIPVPVVIPKA